MEREQSDIAIDKNEDDIIEGLIKKQELDAMK